MQDFYIVSSTVFFGTLFVVINRTNNLELVIKVTSFLMTILGVILSIRVLGL